MRKQTIFNTIKRCRFESSVRWSVLRKAKTSTVITASSTINELSPF